MRTAAVVFEDHLRRASERDLEGDLRENYHPDCIVITSSGVHRGYAAVRQLGELLFRQLPSAHWTYGARHVAGRFAFLEWTATETGAKVEDGADSFVIEDGKIVAQTIYYTVHFADGHIESA